METFEYSGDVRSQGEDDPLHQRLCLHSSGAGDQHYPSLDNEQLHCSFFPHHLQLRFPATYISNEPSCTRQQNLQQQIHQHHVTKSRQKTFAQRLLPYHSVFPGLFKFVQRQTLLVLVTMFGIILTGVQCQQMRFVVQPFNRSVAEGWTAVLNCTVANREGTVTWTKGGFGLGVERHLPGFDRYSMIGSEERGEYNLQIQDVTIDDEDNFECQVGPSTKYPTGLRSQPAYLSVIVPPERPSIINAPTIAVVLNRPSNITCRADRGKPAAQITWHLNSQRLTHGVNVYTQMNGKYIDTIGVLSFNATMADLGQTIECQAITEFMETPFRTSAKLNVYFPPILNMTLNVTSRNIREHDYIKFWCQGQANPNSVTWKWYLDGEIIPGANSNVYHIHAITPEYNKKKLACEATNIVDSVRLEKLLIVEYGPRITDITDVVGADLGGSAELRCTADGNPEPSVIWRRKDRANLSHRTLSTKSVYRIEEVNTQSFGFYECIASVISFPEVSKETLLWRNEKPEMKSVKQQSASEGEKGKLECLARSIPKPISVIWTKDGREINYALSGRFSVEKKDLGQHVQSILHIQVVESGDFGLYNCTIENDKGVSSEQVELIEKHVLPITYIIIGIIGGLAFIFVTALVCVLYRRCKKEDQGSVLGSYTDTDSSSDKKREKADSPNTLMGQLRQEYRFSADYDDMPYKTLTTITPILLHFVTQTANEEGKRDSHSLLTWATCRKWRQVSSSDQQTKGNNNGYGFIEPCETYSDTQIYDGDYVRRGEDLIPDRLDPLYNTGTGYSMSSFRGNYYDTTPPPTMTRLTPLHMSNTKLATDV
ncbi:kin of IRRE-like protein 1 isoform X4 [Biomphalaria glabrata]|uniref:Kin of IRRE-like protein 1 isoform X4 n=1 Tax=Biomphalaria glabrata TaxID=6526 RepID=A0A9W2YT09_BIOGL|nr:kin of IRRE-like protein 1 isoform X4 [Biomphalaria glabrata]